MSQAYLRPCPKRYDLQALKGGSPGLRAEVQEPQEVSPFCPGAGVFRPSRPAQAGLAPALSTASRSGRLLLRGLSPAILLCCLAPEARAQDLQIAVSTEARAEVHGARDDDAAEPGGLHHERMLAVGPSFTHASGEAGAERSVSLLLGQFSSLQWTFPGAGAGELGWAHSGSGFAALGGGLQSVEGGVGMDLETGPMLSLSSAHGVFVRSGLAAELQGNHLYYASWLTLPRLSVGYRFHQDSALLDLSVFAAPSLIGRMKLQGLDAPRALGEQLEHGARLSVSWDWVKLDFAAQLFASPRDARTASLRVGACGQLTPITTLCFRGRLLDAPLHQADLGHAQAASLGFFLGVGALRIKTQPRPRPAPRAAME